MERKILDALIECGCIEEPPLIPRTATAREIAHMIYNKDEYFKNPNNCDYLATCYMIEMEKRDDLGNSGEPSESPEIAMKRGHWFIKWHAPSE